MSNFFINTFTVLRSEIRRQLDSPALYIVVLVFLLLVEFLYFRVAFLVGTASLRALFDFLPWVMLLFVSALTMTTFAEERGEGTLEFLLTRPIRTSEIVLGKFLAVFVIGAAALLFMVPIGWGLSFGGDLDWGVLFAQYIASVSMFAVFAALGIAASSFFERSIAALFVTIASNFLLLIIGSALITLRLPHYIGSVCEQLSILTHFDSMARGVLDLRDVWYTVSFVVLLLVIAVLSISRLRGIVRDATKGMRRWIIICALVFLSLSNVFGSALSGRIDLTAEGAFTLAPATKNLLRDLDEMVKITLYSSEELPAQLQPIVRDVKDVLRDYRTFGRSNILVVNRNPMKSEELKAEAQQKGIQEMQFNVIGQEEFQVKRGYFGIVIETEDEESEVIPFIQETSDLEYLLSTHIKNLTVEQKRKIAFVRMGGTRGVEDGFSMLAEELKSQFDVSSFDIETGEAPEESIEEKIANMQNGGLNTGGKSVEDFMADLKSKEGKDADENEEIPSIPDDVDAIILAGPMRSLSGEYLQPVIDYINDGGSALLMTEGISVMQQYLIGIPIEERMDSFLEKFGVSVAKNLVYDLKSHQRVRSGGGFFSVFIPYPYWINALPAEDAPMQVLKDVETVFLPWASELVLSPETAESHGLTVVPLLQTSNGGGMQESDFSLQPQTALPQSNLTKRTVAAAVYANENMSSKAGRIIVVGDTDFFTDETLQQSSTNLVFASNAISWLAQEESMAGIRVKQTKERKLIFENPSTVSFIKYGNMTFVIGMLLLIGGLRLYRRKMLRMMTYAAGA